MDHPSDAGEQHKGTASRPSASLMALLFLASPINIDGFGHLYLPVPAHSKVLLSKAHDLTSPNLT
jgi:hypothetical protein